MRIGFFKEYVDLTSELNDCEKIFNDFEELKGVIKKGDTLVLASILSLYDVELDEVINLIKLYDLRVESPGINGSTSQGLNIFTLQIGWSIIEFIKDDKERFKRLVEKI